MLIIIGLRSCYSKAEVKQSVTRELLSNVLQKKNKVSGK